MPLRYTFESVSSIFPLLLLPPVSNPYVANDAYVNPPLRPTLWVLGPQDANGWSPDWLSSAFMRFLKLEGLLGKVDLRWCNSVDQGVNGKLPCLHLTDGDLLSGNEISGWISKYLGVKEQLETEEDLREQAEREKVEDIEVDGLKRRIERDIVPILHAPPAASSLPLPARLIDSLSSAVTYRASRALTFLHDRFSLSVENMENFTRIPTAEKTRETVAELRRQLESGDSKAADGGTLKRALAWAALYELQMGRAGREWEYSGAGLSLEKWN
ncbi:hypothetical protein BT69DRAFT_1350977 [Atractiella rhizophila]|nr:hypothetical protein BT69DRAFT_1350977 [Atractiella rhizophila]